MQFLEPKMQKKCVCNNR